MHPCRTVPVALFFFAVALATSVRAQETLNTAPDPVSPARIGVLAGHEFIPSTFIEDPFVRTYLQTGLGFGSSLNLVTSPVVVQGQTITGPEGSLLYAVMDLQFQYAVRPWLAIRARLNVIGRMADETPTLVAQGVTFYSGFDLGWLFRMTQSERLYLSGLVGLKNSSTTDVYLQRFVEGIIETGQILPGNKLVVAIPTLRGTIGLQGAYMLSHLTGITVAGHLDYGESMNRDAGDRWYYGVSLAFDLNLHSNNGVPVGFVIGGSTGSASDLEGIDNQTSQTIFGRIAYTGAEQFALGLDLAYNYVPIRGLEEKQNFLSAVVDIRLFF